MKLVGEYLFPNAPQELVWEMFLDPTVLASIMPGCERLEKVREQDGETQYEGDMKIKVGPVQGKFQGTVILSHLQPPQSYQIKVHGKGPQGIVDGVGSIQLAAGNAGTQLQYEGNANISGQIAAVGQRLMDSSAKAIVKQSLQNLDAQIQARLTAAQAPTPAEPQLTISTDQPLVANISQPTSSIPHPTPKNQILLPPPSQTEFAFGVAKEVLNDLLPKDENQRLLIGAISLLALYLFLRGIVRRWSKQIAKDVARELKRNR